MLTEIAKKELTEHLLPFWKSLYDERGGFYGHMKNDLIVEKDADKGVILNSRTLWFYSNCYLTLGGEDNLKMARHAYEFLRDHCYDSEYGGVYWMMDYLGNPKDTMKHTYNCAFAIYALSSYYDASKDKEALDLAYKIFNTIETVTRDEYGYREAFSREWELVENDALSENGLMADKTMNTVLHLIEGYTELYRVDHSEAVAKSLRYLLDTMSDRVFDPETYQLKVFFNTKMEVIGDIHSYGHDIEATWLMDRACEVLGDAELTEYFKKMNLCISDNIKKLAFDNGALNNERENDKISKKRIWWVQAEGVVGFLNAYQQSGDEDFLKTSQALLDYIMKYVVDKREGGEWFAEVGYDNVPMDTFDMVGPWKCPYHNGRMCVELIRRGID